MKLKKLKIQSFRGLNWSQNEVDFESSNIIFLLWQNNVWKSTFLHAYMYLVTTKQKALLSDFHNHDESIPIIIEWWFKKEEVDDNNKNLNSDPDRVNKWVNDDWYIRVRKKWSNVWGIAQKETFSTSSKTWVKDGFWWMDSLFQKHSPTPIFIEAIESEESLEKKVNDLIKSELIKKIEEEYSDQYNHIVSSIYSLQNEMMWSDKISDYNLGLNTYFQKVFNNLELKLSPKGEDDITLVKAFEKNHSISITKEWNNDIQNFAQHGHGIIRQVLFNFLRHHGSQNPNSSYILLFEEPEIFLHPKAAKKLRSCLYELAEKENIQVMCASHSPIMIDISKEHSSIVRIVRKDNITQTYQAWDNLFHKDDEKKKLVKMLNKFNPHICEVFFANEVLLVEWDTESIVYRDLLSRLYPNKECFVLNTWSKNNIPFFQEALTHFNIVHYIIHDVDTPKLANWNTNSARTLNIKIRDNVIHANNINENLARRLVHDKDFESAHNYNYCKTKWKPLSAFEFVTNLVWTEDLDCINYTNLIWRKEDFNSHDSKYIESLI